MISHLTFKLFREVNAYRCTLWHGGINDWDLSDWGVAAVGELGEACNVIKKLNRCRDGLPGNKEIEEELRVMLAKELADAVTYIDLLALRAGINLGAAVVAKFNEVSRDKELPVYIETADAGEVVVNET
ncbi:MAG: MazG-like family protein [Nitrososphaera sp.]|nr:MazG-like family protein [Nitrososphaera sp.]